ncbi:glycosyltransferase, partial [Halomonas cibimaris]|uniref:glycosyltransferase n=1 Tax=Halomonas cibimaris TaxID=657012 RepID=UPI0031D51BC3
MRIIYLHQYFNTPEMSGGTRSYEMARRMVAAGHEVHMITAYREDDKPGEWFTTDEAGIQVHWYPVPYSNHMSYGQRIKAFFAFAFAARKKALALEGDIVFATSTPLTIAIPGVLASSTTVVTTAVIVHALPSGLAAADSGTAKPGTGAFV